MPDRTDALASWARRAAGVAGGDWSMVSGDASFRRYFRLRDGLRSWVAVDAPPERENTRHFVALATALRERGLPTPQILAQDFEHGFLLIEDFGDTLLLSKLTPANADDLYERAMSLLLAFQRVDALPVTLAPYEPARLQTEMELMPSWLMETHLQRPLNPAEWQHYRQLMQQLLANAAEQPVVLCHRDFHSRNLMLRPGENLFAGTLPGLIDFQDAVWGPVTYDLVSLLRDCYIEWPATRVQEWALRYRDRYVAAGGAPVADAVWLRWFDGMGLQRHLKVLGIFARLSHRDGKRGYLKDLPLTLHYCISVAERHADWQPFAEWLRTEVASRLNADGERRDDKRCDRVSP